MEWEEETRLMLTWSAVPTVGIGWPGAVEGVSFICPFAPDGDTTLGRNFDSW